MNIQETADNLVGIITASNLVNESTTEALKKGTDYEDEIEGEENPISFEMHLAEKIATNYIKKATVRGFKVIQNNQLKEMGL